MKTSGIGYLERYFDPKADPPSLNPRGWEIRETERISIALATVLVAGGIKSRLGSDATRIELAIDKKRAKRVSHALGTALYAWHHKSPKLPSSEEINISGAQLDWDVFVPEHIARAQVELRAMASWAILNNQRRWGRTIVTRIENEVDWIEYAMRD